MPAWIQDVRDMNFFGEPGWADDYYSMSPLYNFSASREAVVAFQIIYSCWVIQVIMG